jgi:putative DNA-invertase from lambdoid prophage Rac
MRKRLKTFQYNFKWRQKASFLTLVLTSSAGKMTMGIVNTMAEFERDLIIERTKMGLINAKKKGIVLGRPRKLTEEDKVRIIKKIEIDKSSVSALAREFRVSRTSIIRVRDKFKINTAKLV